MFIYLLFISLLHNESDSGIHLLPTDFIDDVKLLPGQPDCCSHYILIEVLHRRCSWNGEHCARALKEPSDGDLAGLSVMPFRNLIKWTTLTSKFSSCQRVPGNKADTLASTAIDHLFGSSSCHILRRTIHQIVTVLNGNNGHNLLCLCKLLYGNIRDPYMANLSFLSHFRECTDGVFKWNIGVRAMELVDVDTVETQALQAPL
jgi:hypothetical protein